MSRERKTLAGPEKLAILRRYLVEKVPISNLCDQYGLQPSQVYYWQAQLFEHGASIFERRTSVPTDPRAGLLLQRFEVHRFPQVRAAVNHHGIRPCFSAAVLR